MRVATPAPFCFKPAPWLAEGELLALCQCHTYPEILKLVSFQRTSNVGTDAHTHKQLSMLYMCMSRRTHKRVSGSCVLADYPSMRHLKVLVLLLIAGFLTHNLVLWPWHLGMSQDQGQLLSVATNFWVSAHNLRRQLLSALTQSKRSFVSKLKPCFLRAVPFLQWQAANLSPGIPLAVGQNQWYHVGVGALLVLVGIFPGANRN